MLISAGQLLDRFYRFEARFELYVRELSSGNTKGAATGKVDVLVEASELRTRLKELQEDNSNRSGQERVFPPELQNLVRLLEELHSRSDDLDHLKVAEGIWRKFLDHKNSFTECALGLILADAKFSPPRGMSTYYGCILVFDQVGSTPDAATRSSEQQSGLMSQRLAMVSSILGPVHPLYDNFTGDGKMLMLDNPMVAVRTAVELHNFFKNYSEQNECNTICCRVGIHYGSCAVVRNGQTIEFSGAAPSIASKLMKQALPGGVAISKVTSDTIHPKDLQPNWSFQSLGSFPLLKEYMLPTTVHALLVDKEIQFGATSMFRRKREATARRVKRRSR